MRSLVVSAGIAALAFLFVVLQTAAAEEKTCKQVMADLTKRQLGGITACSKSMKFKNGKEKAKKMNCILKCVMVKENMLDSEGYFKAEQLDALILREFPASLQEKANATLNPCVAKSSEIDPSPADEFCKSYDPFIKCMLGALPNLCT